MSGSDFRRRNPPEERFREIEVLIISAQDLKNVKHVTRMRAYATVYVEKGGANPTWNEVVRVKFREELPGSDVMVALNVDIYAHGHLREKPGGSAWVLLCDVLRGGDAADPADNPIQCLTVHVWRPQGLLNLWVPPTGRFLTRRASLSFSISEMPDAAEEEGKQKVAEVVAVPAETENEGVCNRSSV